MLEFRRSAEIVLMIFGWVCQKALLAFRGEVVWCELDPRTTWHKEKKLLALDLDKTGNFSDIRVRNTCSNPMCRALNSSSSPSEG